MRMKACLWQDNGCYFRCIEEAVANIQFYKEDEDLQREYLRYCKSNDVDPNAAICGDG